MRAWSAKRAQGAQRRARVRRFFLGLLFMADARPPWGGSMPDAFMAASRRSAARRASFCFLVS